MCKINDKYKKISVQGKERESYELFAIMVFGMLSLSLSSRECWDLSFFTSEDIVVVP